MMSVLFDFPITLIFPRPPRHRAAYLRPGLMLINLLPDFFAVLNSTDRVSAYQRYFNAHRRILEAYWHNYVVDPEGPHFLDVVRSAAMADRTDLREMLERSGEAGVEFYDPERVSAAAPLRWASVYRACSRTAASL